MSHPSWHSDSTQEHSEEPFSAGAWLSHGDGDLEPLQDWSSREAVHGVIAIGQGEAPAQTIKAWRICRFFSVLGLIQS